MDTEYEFQNKKAKDVKSRSDQLFKQIFQRSLIFTLSNALSFARLLSGIYIYYLIQTHQVFLSVVVIALAIVSDFLDGYFARKQHQISELGKILDPLADKFCIGLASIALYQGYGLPLWLVVLIIGRDVFILIGSVVLMTRLNYVVASAWPGKIAVTIISALLLSHLFQIRVLQVPLQALTLLFLLFSAGYYAIKFYHLLKRKEKVNVTNDSS
ncbi:MAG: CDP-alcohol phosphatidyltransferase family protein [Calditrichaeota bacterium]|nr:CDP-alcohol phosphatidyltransferase family protein [Calditrichota bacterium]